MTATLSLINGIVSDLRCEDAPTDCAGYVEGRLQGANCAELNLPYRRPAFACSRTGRQLSLDALGAASMRTTQSIVANRELLRWHNLLLDERAGGPEIDVFYTDVPFGEERNPDAARYLEFTNQLVHVANDFLSRNGGVVPVEKASEFIEFLQTEAIVPFVQILTRGDTMNQLIFDGGSLDNAPYCRWTAAGAVIPVRMEDGSIEYYYLEQAILAFSHMQDGMRVPSITPAHGHAANVGYVTAAVPHTAGALDQSCLLTEQLFDVRIAQTGQPFVSADGTVSPLGIANGGVNMDALALYQVDEECTPLSRTPTAIRCIADTQQQELLDCLQRPHRVQPRMNATNATPLMMGTYFGPKALIQVFPDDRVHG